MKDYPSHPHKDSRSFYKQSASLKKCRAVDHAALQHILTSVSAGRALRTKQGAENAKRGAATSANSRSCGNMTSETSEKENNT